MHQEAERLLTKVAQVKNIADRGRTLQRATRFMTKVEKDNKQAELDRIKETLSPTNIGVAAITQEGRATMSKYKNYLERDLEDNVAPEVSRDARDDLIRAEKALAEKISNGMLPHEVMRRNPPGAVGHHMKWLKENGDDVLTWKNLRRALYPDDDSEDLANIEILRKSDYRIDGAPTYNANAQIAGVFAMTPQAKDNWPENMPEFGTANSAWAQAIQRENAELKAQLEGINKELKKKHSHSSALNYKPWTCEYVPPDEPEKGPCGKTVPLYSKGVHIGYHKRMEKAVKQGEKALKKLVAEREAREAAEHAQPGNTEQS